MPYYQLGHSEYITIKGWECPKCRAVMAPSAISCLYCKPVKTDMDGIEKCCHGAVKALCTYCNTWCWENR